MVQDLGTDRAQTEPTEAATTAGTDDKQVAVPRGFQQFLHRNPLTERTCTEAGRAGPASRRACWTASSAAWRSFSCRLASAGTGTGAPVTKLAITE